MLNKLLLSSLPSIAADVVDKSFTLGNPSRASPVAGENRSPVLHTSGAYIEFPPACEETPASRLAAPRDHAPLGHVAVLRMQIMTLIVVPASRFPIRDFNDNFYTHAL